MVVKHFTEKDTKDIFRNQQVDMRLYPAECSQQDTVGDSGFLKRVLTEFGMRAGRGTALAYYDGEDELYCNTEDHLRSFLRDKQINRIVEIGTYRGVSSALLSHYAKEVVTVDIYLEAMAVAVWIWCGVNNKIRYYVIQGDNMKRQALKDEEYDFAFIDGMHTYECVKFDYELLKGCGRVLFHDYGIAHCPDVKRFVDTLPENEVIKEMPFAYWERK